MPADLVLSSDSPTRTHAIGRCLGRILEPGDVVALAGALGSGKTVLVRGIAEGLEVRDPRRVSSPTFVIIHEHPGRLTLYHVDVYRLAGPAELDALGFDEICASGGVVVVEWADRVAGLLPNDHVRIDLELSGPNSRRLVFTAAGPAATRVIAAMAESCP